MDLDPSYIVIGSLVPIALAVLLLWRWLRAKPTTELPANAIVVDGSNVLHWGGEPSEKVLRRVIDALKERDLAPIVIFDANVGYKLENRFIGSKDMARKLGLLSKYVYVVHKGVVADEVLLDFATEHGLRVVSKDRFRDWQQSFPLVKAKGRLIRGFWKEGSVSFDRL